MSALNSPKTPVVTGLPREKGQGLLEYALVLVIVAIIVIFCGGGVAYFLWNVPVVALTGLAAISFKQAIWVHLVFGTYFGIVVGFMLAVQAAVKKGKEK